MVHSIWRASGVITLIAIGVLIFATWHVSYLSALILLGVGFVAAIVTITFSRILPRHTP